MHPLISIIIPVYNAELFLQKCIDSILAQTFSEWELILVNDGSNDNSGQICDYYSSKFSNVKAIHKANEGVSSARNLALTYARGEWVTFVDSDDYVDPDWLKSVHDIMAVSVADMYFWGIKFENTDGKIRDLFIPTEDRYEKSYKYIGSVDYRHNPVVFLYKKDWIEKYNCKFPVGIKRSEDQCFNLQYLSHNPTIKRVRKAFYHYVNNPDSVMNKEPRVSDFEDHFLVALYIIDYACKYCDIEKKFVIKAVERLLKDYLYFIQVFNLVSDPCAQPLYNKYYSIISNTFPTLRMMLIPQIARCSLSCAMFVDAHIAGIKKRLFFC